MGRKLDEIIKNLPAERQVKIETLARKKVEEMLAHARTLTDFRKAVGKTQTEVAQELGIKQNAVSQLEQRSDTYVSTLRRFLGSLGMRLELSVVTKRGVRIDLPHFHPWQDAIEATSSAGKSLAQKTAAARRAVVATRQAPLSATKKKVFAGQKHSNTPRQA